jgi:outer membrane usher protein
LSAGWDGADAGFAASGSWQSPRRREGGLLRLAAEYVDADFLTLSTGGYRRRPGVALAAQYMLPVAGMTASFAATYRNDFASLVAQEEWSADAALSAEIADGLAASLSAGFASGEDLSGTGGCGCDLIGLDGIRAVLRLTYRPDHRSFVTLAHDTSRGGTYANYGRNSGSGTGAWSLSAGGTNESESEAADLNLAASHTGNRAEISLSHSARTEGISLDGAFRPESTEQRTSLRVQTALAYADGVFALGRPVSGAFAIIEPHEALGGPVTAGGSTPIARSGDLGPALIPDIASYTPRRIEVDSVSEENLSAAAELRFMAPYKAGHRVTAGSAYTLTVIGTLLGPDGEPLAMQSGAAREDGRDDTAPIEVFTNKSGRFAVEGVAPGRWRIEIEGEETALRYVLDIPADARGMVQAGALRPAP